MARNGAPAKPWYDTVIATIAVRGWTKAELSDRSGVARTTIDNWERNPRKPQAKSVNAVADAVGIPREQALRLAGIIAEAAEAERSPPREPTAIDRAFGEDAGRFRAAMASAFGDGAARKLRLVEEALSQQLPEDDDAPREPGAQPGPR